MHWSSLRFLYISNQSGLLCGFERKLSFPTEQKFHAIAMVCPNQYLPHSLSSLRESKVSMFLSSIVWRQKLVFDNRKQAFDDRNSNSYRTCTWLLSFKPVSCIYPFGSLHLSSRYCDSSPIRFENVPLLLYGSAMRKRVETRNWQQARACATMRGWMNFYVNPYELIRANLLYCLWRGMYNSMDTNSTYISWFDMRGTMYILD